MRRGYAEIYAASLHVIIASTAIVWQRNGTREQSWTTKQANRQHEQEDNCQKLSLVFNRKGCNQTSPTWCGEFNYGIKVAGAFIEPHDLRKVRTRNSVGRGTLSIINQSDLN